MRFDLIARPLCAATCSLFVFSASAQGDDTVKRLSEYQAFSELKFVIGREPGRSEAGGACGGIVIHDWIEEGIRVVTLGEGVQVVSELDTDNSP